MQALSPNLTTSADRNLTFPLEKGEPAQAYLSPINNTSNVGLVLIQEWWGLNKSIMTIADIFAAEGFKVLCPDMYRGKVAKDSENAGHLLTGLDWKDALEVIGGAATYLQQSGCTKIGILGFCMGGALSIAGICSYPDKFNAAAPFYGIPDLNKFDVGKIKCPVLLHFAELDEAKGFSDPESAKNLSQKMTEKGVNHRLIIWEKGQHAFMNQDSPKFDKDISEKARKETIEFFKKHLN